MIKNPIYIKDKNEEYENNFTMFFNDMKKNLKKLNEYTNEPNRKVVERDLSSINNKKSNVFLNVIILFAQSLFLVWLLIFSTYSLIFSCSFFSIFFFLNT